MPPNSPHILLVGRLAVAQTEVQITFPQEGARFTAPTFFVVEAQASQPGGSISRVDFYVDDNRIGSPETEVLLQGDAGDKYVWLVSGSVSMPQGTPWLTNTAGDTKLQVTLPLDSKSAPRFYRTRKSD